MVIFDRSWYLRVLDDRVDGVVTDKEARDAFNDIIEFERMLADDGAVILKFFLHISKKEQKERFHLIEQDPLEAWRVSDADWARHKKYDAYLAAADEALELTEAAYAPWSIVEATSKWWARKKIFETIVAALEKRLGDLAPPAVPENGKAAMDAQLRAAGETMGEGDR